MMKTRTTPDIQAGGESSTGCKKQHWMRSTVVVWGGGSNVYAVRFQTFKREEGTTLDGNECMSSTQVAVTYQRRIVGTVKKCISVTHACVWLNSSAKSHE